MIDFFTVELPDPVGIPVNAGQVMKITPDGEIEWSVPTRVSVEGSHESNMTFRAIAATSHSDEDSRAKWELRPGEYASGLEVSGNPAKFNFGHNFFGSDDLHHLIDLTVNKAKDSIWPDLFESPQIDYSQGLLSRIDLTASWVVKREADVLPVLQALEQSARCGHRGRGVFDAGGTTLYYGRTEKGKRAKDWTLKLYWKGPEIVVHPVPEAAYSVPGLLDEVNRTIRVELTLRTPELKRLGMREVGRWTAAKVGEIWEAYVAKLNFCSGTVNLDAQDLAELGLKPRHLTALAAWKAGNDLRTCMTRPTYYRLRKELYEATGYDIANKVPKSNVVPLRRMVTVAPAQYPTWADHLSEALARAA